MVRRYFSLLIPAVFSAACGLTYLHFRNQAAAQAAEPVLQIAQAEVAPAPAPVPKAAPKPDAKPAAPLVYKAKPGQPIILRHKPKARPEKPKNIDEVQSPMLKQLLTQLDGVAEGTAEEKDSLRDIIFSADLELRDSMGDNMKKRIEKANKTRFHFYVKKPSPVAPLVKPKPGEIKPAPQTPAVPKAAAPPAEAPAEPKKDVFDDVFGEKKQP